MIRTATTPNQSAPYLGASKPSSRCRFRKRPDELKHSSQFHPSATVFCSGISRFDVCQFNSSLVSDSSFGLHFIVRSAVFLRARLVL